VLNSFMICLCGLEAEEDVLHMASDAPIDVSLVCASMDVVHNLL
jgi:hypothetical protein